MQLKHNSTGSFDLVIGPHDAVRVLYQPEGINAALGGYQIILGGNVIAALQINALTLPTGRLILELELPEVHYIDDRGKAIYILDDPNGADEITLKLNGQEFILYRR